MKKELEIGLSREESFTIKDCNSAKYLGSGSLEVLATPAMVAFMENTAMNCVSEFLDEGMDTVGVMINTTHIKASKIGDSVVCKASLSEIDGRKLCFTITASDSKGIIGEAKHERFIINKEKFLSRL